MTEKSTPKTEFMKGFQCYQKRLQTLGYTWGFVGDSIRIVDRRNNSMEKFELNSMENVLRGIAWVAKIVDRSNHVSPQALIPNAVALDFAQWLDARSDAIHLMGYTIDLRPDSVTLSSLLKKYELQFVVSAEGIRAAQELKELLTDEINYPDLGRDKDVPPTGFIARLKAILRRS